MFSIAVIGGGVNGVTAAVQLQQDVPTARITIYADTLSPGTTGDVSAGFWTPYLLEKTPDSDITKWSKVTHDFLEQSWRAGRAQQLGICLLPSLRFFAAEGVQLPEWATVPYGACLLPSEQVQRLSQQHGKKYSAVVHYVTYTVEPTKLLPQLMQEFLGKGGQLVQRKVETFSELAHYDVIVNCAGLAARDLANDPKVHAIRGQVSRVKAPWQFHILMDECDDGNYIIPNISEVVLGGTHQVANENLSVNPDDKAFILDGSAKIVPALKAVEEHKDAVGLRPGRSKVRLEAERITVDGRTLNVVHNYGHGGAGVTLCFGCAVDVSGLVRQTLGISHVRSRL